MQRFFCYGSVILEIPHKLLWQAGFASEIANSNLVHLVIPRLLLSVSDTVSGQKLNGKNEAIVRCCKGNAITN